MEPTTRSLRARLARLLFESGAICPKRCKIISFKRRYRRKASPLDRSLRSSCGSTAARAAFELDKAPGALIDIAVRAARPIGEGFYGVDVKETDRGFIVMEVNDNPNLEHGIEDQVGKDEVWTRLLRWFVERFEQ
jgi:RimK-like ATP-grasp domain